MGMGMAKSNLAAHPCGSRDRATAKRPGQWGRVAGAMGQLREC